MSGTGNDVPVVEVDEVFPSLTTALPAGRTSTGDVDGAPTVATVLRNVLGWRPRDNDTKGFLAALDSSFALDTVGATVVSTYTPRSFALQADLGSVTGGQASLFSRASNALDQMLPLLEGLEPLQIGADPDDCAALRSLVRDSLVRVVGELGTPGGPRVARVDTYISVLVGASPAEPLGLTSADDVGGQLGRLREAFGLEDRFVSTVEDEQVRTSFWTLSDLVVDVANSWAHQRRQFTRSGSSAAGFLGTDLVLISRALAAASDQVADLETILDSVFVPRSERQTLWLPHAGMTVDDGLSWAKTVLAEEAVRIVTDGGRDGIEYALTPILRQLYSFVRDNLTVPERPQRSGVATLHGTKHLPAGFSAGRTRLAVINLRRLLGELYVLVARVHRRPAPHIYDIEIDTTTDDAALLRITARVANCRDELTLRLSAPGVDVAELDGFDVSIGGDSVTAFVDLRPWLAVAAPVHPGTPVTVHLVDVTDGVRLDSAPGIAHIAPVPSGRVGASGRPDGGLDGGLDDGPDTVVDESPPDVTKTAVTRAATGKQQSGRPSRKRSGPPRSTTNKGN